MKSLTGILGLVLAVVLGFGDSAVAKANLDADASTNVDANVSGVETDLRAGVQGVVNAIIGEDSETAVSGDTEASVSGEVNANVPRVIIMTRADVAGGASTTAPVRTEADLSGFVAAELVADANVSRVETSSDAVSVTYKQRARLFGLIPVTVNATVIVDADGSVDVRYPWYAFLMTTNEASLEAELAERADATIGASAEAEASLAPPVQAALISEITSVLESEFAADVAASANVRAGASVE